MTAGMVALKASTPDAVEQALPILETEVDCNPEAYRDFCIFAFKYCLTARPSAPSQNMFVANKAVL